MTIFGFLRPLEAKSCKATIEQLCSGNPLAYVLSMVGAQYSCWARKFKFLAVKITQDGHFWLFEASIELRADERSEEVLSDHPKGRMALNRSPEGECGAP